MTGNKLCFAVCADTCVQLSFALRAEKVAGACGGDSGHKLSDCCQVMFCSDGFAGSGDLMGCALPQSGRHRHAVAICVSLLLREHNG